MCLTSANEAKYIVTRKRKKNYCENGQYLGQCGSAFISGSHNKHSMIIIYRRCTSTCQIILTLVVSRKSLGVKYSHITFFS